MAEEIKEIDVLEQVKRIDKAVKAKLLIEKITQLKECAREINVLREQSVATLEELGLSDKDMKRIIDYINELPEVKLSEKDKEKIRDEIHDEVSEEKTDAENILRDVDLSKLFGSSGTGATGGMYTTTTSTGGPITVTSLSGNDMWNSSMTNSVMMMSMSDSNGGEINLKL